VLEKTAKELDPSGKRVAWSRTDITKPEDCAKLAAVGRERFGQIDGLVQVAAYEASMGDPLTMDLESWRRCFETNVLGSMELVRGIAPGMKETGGGSIVLIGSQSMFLPLMPQAGYAASKGALLSAMYYLAKDLGPDQIRVNMVVPSWMWGPPVQGLIKYRAKTEGRTEAEVLADITDTIPLRRMAADEDVAEMVIFLCSDRAQCITGQNILVNAGEMLR
jgi:NAD(P)-dependent dehydrogenase (short-subunit alcohol dehydrogenase family)